MTTPHRLHELATLLEHLDAGSLTVGDVQTPGQHLIDDDTLTVQLRTHIEWDVPTNIEGQVSVTIPAETTVSGDQLEDGFEIPLEVTIDPPATEPSTAVEQSPETADTQITDGGVTMSAPSAPADDSPSAANPRGEHAPSDGDSTEATDTPDQPSGASADSPPPHRDPARLQAVYDAHETFREMTAALETDVTPQTVRHHMIKEGIHQPDAQTAPAQVASEQSDATTSGAASSPPSASESAAAPSDSQPGESQGDTSEQSSTTATSSADAVGAESETRAAPQDADDPEPSAAAGGTQSPTPIIAEDLPPEIDLPSHLTVDEILQAVAESQTLFEVQRALRIDRTQARQLLQDLNILSFVSGRVATAETQQAAIDELMEQLRDVCS